jgi:hypothetical protein
MAKQLIVLGVIIILIGVLWMLAGKYLPWLGNLPGDFKWQGTNFKIYFPLATLLLISVLLNLIWWLYKYFSR